tara:strand:- start:73 stop:1359 length:1287 start_codon:yes stop_codon:yes gene_type:complete
MARNRVIYQSQAVYVSQDAPYDGNLTGSFDGTNTFLPNILNLDRVQSCNYSFNISRQDVNQFGDLAAIDRIITDTPTVSIDASYILANFSNEKRLGFAVGQSGDAAGLLTSCISGIIDSSTNNYQKDYFILTTKEGSDANLLSDSGKYDSIIGIGNGFLSSYSSEASVGGLPTASVSVEGMNMNAVKVPYFGFDMGNPGNTTKGFFFPYDGVSNNFTGISGENPAINPVDGTKVDKLVCLPLASGDTSGAGAGLISALRPGDITLTLGKKLTETITNSTGGNNDSWDIAGANINDAHIQSYTISFDLSRTPIQKLGTRFAFARPVDFPITASLSIDAVLSDLTTGNLSDLIDCDGEYDAIVKMKDPSTCGGAVKSTVCSYVLKGLKMDSESFSSSIGDNKSVTLDFSCQVGGPSQKGVGVFMSGWYAA